MELRPYQRAAVAAFWRHIRHENDNPCVVIPTAGGKTPVMATICRDAVVNWGGRVLILAHVRELLQQTADKLHRICPDIPFGIYSAGLNRRDTEGQVIVAGIQSVYKRAVELGAFDIVLVDEAHLIPLDGEGMYRTFLSDLRLMVPHVRVGGMTATPYRLDSGLICRSDAILNRVCYEISVKELMDLGYLSRVISRDSQHTADLSGVHQRGGEYIASELEAAMIADESVMRAACAEIVERSQGCKGILVFTSGIGHGRMIRGILADLTGEEVGWVDGNTPSAERRDVLEAFQRQEIRWLANVNVLTTGYDATHIDCVALLRPTMSPGLYYQMVGRGFRLHPGKEYCLVLDYGTNILRHGPVDQINTTDGKKLPNWICPDCETVNAGWREVCELCKALKPRPCPKCEQNLANEMHARGFATFMELGQCPHCGHEFVSVPRNPPALESKASSANVVSQGEGEAIIREYDVEEVTYSLHVKGNGLPPRSLRVDYQTPDELWPISEWVCVEHTGYAREKAEWWWRLMAPPGLPCPTDADKAVRIANSGALRRVLRILTKWKKGDKFRRITNYDVSDRTEIELEGPIEFEEPAEVEAAEAEAATRQPEIETWDVPF